MTLEELEAEYAPHPFPYEGADGFLHSADVHTPHVILHWASTHGACQLQSFTLFMVALVTKSSTLAEALTVRLMLGGSDMGII